MRIICITGGIGSGKSVVSRLLLMMGYPVYDCDSHAKSLMDNSVQIKSELRECFGNDIILENGAINRPLLAKIIFSDKTSLKKVDEIVHPRVIEEIKMLSSKSDSEIYFVETALPHESGLDVIADGIWMVDAPIDIRLNRIINRNKISESEALSRINSQDFSNLENNHVCYLLNDGVVALLPQIFSLLKK